MAPFTVPAVGNTYWFPPVVGLVNCVGPLYGVSVLLTPLLVGSGWVMVLVGHWTRNDCALAGVARTQISAPRITGRDTNLLSIRLASSCSRRWPSLAAVMPIQFAL